MSFADTPEETSDVPPMVSLFEVLLFSGETIEHIRSRPTSTLALECVPVRHTDRDIRNLRQSFSVWNRAVGLHLLLRLTAPGTLTPIPSVVLHIIQRGNVITKSLVYGEWVDRMVIGGHHASWVETPDFTFHIGPDFKCLLICPYIYQLHGAIFDLLGV